jgi:paraquat-inducible protein A
MAKLIALAYLLIIVRSRSSGSNLDRTRLYRLIDFVGRWSMLDVFVVTLAVALVQIQPFVLAKPGPGVPFFAAVVVLTMLAAKTFDPRLIWDSDTEKEEPHARKS